METLVHEHVARPEGRHSMHFQWLNLLFLHWPVPVEALRPLLPRELTVDTFDGTAWVGLVPFAMRNVRHTRLPPVPTMQHFLECNVRTYVSHGDDRGVWFFSLDAASWLAVVGARATWNLNYLHSRMLLKREGNVVHYEVQRRRDPGVTMRCIWRVGRRREPAAPGNLDHFLTERYMLFTVNRRGRLFRSRIWHEPWPLHDAGIIKLEESLVASNGIELGGAAPHPLILAAEQLDVNAWGLEEV